MISLPYINSKAAADSGGFFYHANWDLSLRSCAEGAIPSPREKLWRLCRNRMINENLKCDYYSLEIRLGDPPEAFRVTRRKRFV